MLSPLGQNTVSRGMQQAKTLLETVLPALQELNVAYNAAGGFKGTIQQADLDLVASFSGLTKQQLDDGMYALTTTLLNDINAAYNQLCQLATRA